MAENGTHCIDECPDDYYVYTKESISQCVRYCSDYIERPDATIQLDGQTCADGCGKGVYEIFVLFGMKCACYGDIVRSTDGTTCIPKEDCHDII